MPEGRPSSIHRLGVACGVLLAAGLLVLWISVVVRELRVVQARGDLVRAIERGDADSVATLIDRIDPTWGGSAEDWSGDSSLKGQQGFSWLIERWISHGHTKGVETLHRRRIVRDAAFPRSELIGPLEWLGSQGDRESLEAYFEFLLGIPYPGGDAGAERALERVLGFAERDAGLALLAWEARNAGTLVADLPDKVIATATRRSRFADPESLARLLRLMGLLDPVETFVVREAPPDPSGGSGSAWMERSFRILADSGDQEVRRAREILDRTYFSDVAPETPGLFLWRRLFLDSAESGTGEHREFSPGEIEPALPVFDRLPPEGKAGVARLLDRLIPDYAGHESLRRWVGEHVRPGWEEQRQRFLALAVDQLDEHGDSAALKEWLRSAAKHGRADGSTAAVMHLHRLREERRVSREQFQIHGAPDQHPFFLATIDSLWTREGTPPLPSQFSLVLAFARDPSLPPCESFPNLKRMGYLKASGAYERSPWYRASAGEFNEAVTRLGEPFADHPLRFLMVPFFHELANNFSQTLQQPAELAAFQKLAALNDLPGGWLAKDLADLIPRWWCQSRGVHDALLAEGGHSFSYDRVYAYLEDRTTPVAARASYALGIFDWHMAPIWRGRSAEIGATPPYFPEMDELALEFADEFKGGKWSEESISQVTWDRIVRGWLDEPSTPDSGDRARNRRSARRALLSRMEPYVRGKFASSPPPAPGSRLTALDGLAPFLRTYATLLRLEEDDEALSALWDEAERTLADPRAIFSSFPVGRGDRSQILGGASADAIVRRYRERGWEGAREQVAEMDGATAYSALSEATSRLSLREWVDFCGKALDLRTDPNGPGRNGWDRFCSIPPASLLKAVRSLKDDERIPFVASEFSGVEIPQRHAGFFALALPPMIRNCVNRGDAAADYIRAMTEPGKVPVSPLILREVETACRSSASLIEPRHLDALRSGDIPIAQRWIGSAFFHISRDNRPAYVSRLEEWPAELRTLAEVGVDLMVEAVGLGLPVWHLMDRGLGSLDSSPGHATLPVATFLSLYRLDKASQARRASSLTETGRIVELLRDHPNRMRLLDIYYSLALQMDERPLAVDLFVEAEPNLSFEEKLRWLSLGKFHVPMARLFSREWPRIAELTLGFGSFSQGGELDAILAALPDDPDLRRLVRATLQHHSMSTSLVDPGSARIFDAHSTVVNAFLRDEFKSSRMEALCLARLPIRMEQSPQLCDWLDNRLKGRDWEAMLAESSTSIRQDWPYWARRIEALAGSGDFEALAGMLPAAPWFANRPRPFDDGYPAPDADTIEEMVWMGFARPVAYHLRFGALEDRLEAGTIAARLLSAPPASARRDEVRSLQGATRYRSTSFHADAARELWLYAIAATLSATLDESADAAIGRCGGFELPPIRSVTSDPLINGASHQSFFRLLAEFAETMTGDERTTFFLRGFETSPFTRRTLTKALPCYSLARIQLPREISLDDMARLAETRRESAPDAAVRIADLGLVLQLAGDEAAAFPLLERALTGLDPGNSEDLAVLEAIKPVHARIGRAAGSGTPAARDRGREAASGRPVQPEARPTPR